VGVGAGRWGGAGAGAGGGRGGGVCEGRVGGGVWGLLVGGVRGWGGGGVGGWGGGKQLLKVVVEGSADKSVFPWEACSIHKFSHTGDVRGG